MLIVENEINKKSFNNALNPKYQKLIMVFILGIVCETYLHKY